MRMCDPDKKFELETKRSKTFFTPRSQWVAVEAEAEARDVAEAAARHAGEATVSENGIVETGTGIGRGRGRGTTGRGETTGTESAETTAETAGKTEETEETEGAEEGIQTRREECQRRGSGIEGKRAALTATTNAEEEEEEEEDGATTETTKTRHATTRLELELEVGLQLEGRMTSPRWSRRRPTSRPRAG